MTQRLSLLSPANLVTSSQIAEPGDCGVVLKPDGSFRVFSMGMENVTGETLTQAQREQGRRMLALSVALQSETIMGMLYGILEDSEVVNHANIAGSVSH